MEAMRLNAVLILLSFIMSTTLAGFIFRKNHNKRISILLALVLNILFLGIAFSFSYTEEMHIFGTGTEEISSLVIAIPLITWVNAFALQFIKPKQPDL